MNADHACNVERYFGPTPKILGGVRRFVRDVLGNAHDAAFLAEAELVASELATNAVMHAQTPFRVSVSSTPDAIRIAVRDACANLPDDQLRHADRNGGRGVSLVAAFSRAWGTRPEPDGKTVWAELAPA